MEVENTQLYRVLVAGNGFVVQTLLMVMVGIVTVALLLTLFVLIFTVGRDRRHEDLMRARHLSNYRGNLVGK